jgi:molybdopterin-guanine dinucleotide biosynthesis protein A
MLSIVIQAGGESRRMGQNKALLLLGGQPLIQRVVERTRPAAAEQLVTANRPEAYAFLGLPVYPDILPGRGALGGLYTALSAAAGELVAVVACDMPFASPALLLGLGAALRANPALAAALPSGPSGKEPFHGVYRREACLPLTRAALEAGAWRVDAWFGQAAVRILSQDETQRFDPGGRAFWNINTPDDLRQAEQFLQAGNLAGQAD